MARRGERVPLGRKWLARNRHAIKDKMYRGPVAATPTKPTVVYCQCGRQAKPGHRVCQRCLEGIRRYYDTRRED